MHAFQVFAALIAGASAVAIHDETAQTWDVAEKASGQKEHFWKPLIGEKGDVVFDDTFVNRNIKLNCRTGSSGGELCCRTEPELMPLDDRGRNGADLCEQTGHKRHHYGDVKRIADYSATYIGDKDKSPKGLSILDCHIAMSEIKKDCAATVVGYQSANMTYGGFLRDGEWAYSVNIPLDGKRHV